MKKQIFFILFLFFWIAQPALATDLLEKPYQENVVDYATSWPDLSQVKKDLPRIQQLLKASALRIQISGASLPSITRVFAMQTLLKAHTLQLELIITELNKHEKQSLNWLKQLSQQSSLPLVIIDGQPTTLQRVYARVQSVYPVSHLGIMSSDKQVLKDWARHLSPPPKLFLYVFQAPIHHLHQTIYELDQVMKKTSWQLTRFGSPEELDEYDQAWLYRLVFYFSKKYGLAPASVLFKDQQIEGIYLPGIIREDQKPHTSFWLSQIYFHVKRIDLDEHKLTAALYEYVPENYPIKKFKSAQSMAHYFLLAHYKVTPEVNPLAYISSKKSAVFYDFLQQRSEESLLNSHFSMLENLQVIKHVKHEDNDIFTFSGDFISSIGTFRFAQEIAVKNEPAGFRVSKLGRPQLNSPIKTYTRQKKPLASILISNEEIKTSFYHDTKGDLWLAYQTQPNDDQPMMLQPLYLHFEHSDQILIPHRLDFLFYKSLTANNPASGLINLKESANQTPLFNAKRSSPPHIQPRQFETQIDILKDHVTLTIINPLVERLLLPAVRFSLSSEQHKLTFRSVLPQALLPLEQRVYHLPLPNTVNLETEKFRVDFSEGQGFPILNLEINQDDAFRSKTLDHSQQALIKYREVLKRFGKQLDPERRFRLIREIALLAALLEPEDLFTEIDQNLSLWHPDNHLDHDFYVYLGEKLLQNKHTQQAIIAAQRALKIAPKDLKTWLFLAYIYDTQQAWSDKLSLLNQALAMMPEEIELLKQLVNTYEHIGRYADSAEILKVWLTQEPSADGFNRLAYLSERAHHWQEAIFAYKNVLLLAPQAKTYLSLARVYQRVGQIEPAIDTYQTYLKSCAYCSSSVYADLAYLFKGTGKIKEAIFYFRKHVLATNARSSRVILAELEQSQGLNTEAIKTLLPLVQKCRITCSLQQKQLAYLYQQQKNWAQALKYYKLAFQNSRNPHELSLMAYLEIEANQKQEAINLFKQALAQPIKKPFDKDQWQLSLAALYRQTDQPMLAIPLLKESLSRATTEEKVTSLLAAYLESHQAEAGITFIESQNLIIKHADTHYVIAKLYQEIEQWESAVAPLQMAICTSTTPQLEYYRLLAEAYKQIGEPQRAIVWLNELDGYLSSGSVSGEGPSASLCRL